MNTTGLAAGLKAGVIAGAVSGAPSTVHALVTGGRPLDAARAAGTLFLADDAPPRRLLVAGAVAHGVLSLGWGVVFAAVLPRRRPALWGALAGLVIAGIDLGVVGRRLPRIRALPQWPQIADHVAYGAVVGAALSQMTKRPGARPARTGVPRC
jgi:hypothetical protein